MRYQEETKAQERKLWHLGSKTIAWAAHNLGMVNHEPLIVAMDALIRYAKAYRHAYDSNVADDGVLGEYWLDAARGIRGLLNGDGAVAMERGITTDSKDNGCVEAMFWRAIDIAGFTEEDF